MLSQVTMYCKGADSAIFKILAASNTAEMRRATEEHIDRFACQGLRTLVLAKRELSVRRVSKGVLDVTSDSLAAHVCQSHCSFCKRW